MDKKPIEKILESWLASYYRFLEELSERWREHANRRTIIVLVVSGALLLFLFQTVIRPPDDFPLNKLVTIEDGSSLSAASAHLKEEGVVRSAFAFRAVVTLAGHEGDVHAGDYLFTQPRNIFSVARAIAVGAYGLEPDRIRIPEGATVKEMARIFGGRLLRFNEEKFLKLAAPNEGYLFPDTYFFLPNASEELVVKTMKQNFDAKEAEIDAQVKATGRTLHDIVIMASLLEREAQDARDRRMIAGVLWSRIDKGMPLQVDAAFLYTLGKGTFQLTTADLKSDSPYNTYRYKGLPLGPIGSPSLDSLTAAANPIVKGYLYYLADKYGTTYYSKTYAEHLRKKAIYID